jgi:hypothetical protein
MNASENLSPENLAKRIREEGYEKPKLEFVNPEIRTVSYAAPSLYGRFVFNLDKAVEAFNRGQLLASEEAVLVPEAARGVPVGLALAWTAKEGWYELTPPEREAYWAHIAQAMQQSEREGAKQLGAYHARMSGKCDFFALWEHPSLDTANLQLMRLRQLDFFKYFDLETSIGLSIATR